MTYLPWTESFPWMIASHEVAFATPDGRTMARPQATLMIDDAVAYPWTGSGIALQAGVMFLLALRVRPRVTAQALAITTLAVVLCV
ncbi:hypothetical protein [Nonomuraea sp. B5E05]|uniref:hypothetical protein n=1 Tax=Nonomuraea sp. B5E05 TaxID=3153569 RepID=UPI003261615D